MPRVSTDYIPVYRLHKSSGQAIVTLSQKDHLLGHFGTPASKVKYHELVARWLKNNRRPLDVTPYPSVLDEMTGTLVSVETLCDAYQRFADDEYANPGRRSNFSAVIRLVLRDLRDMFGDTPADAFTAIMLKAVRERWIKRQYVRKSINSYAGVVRRMFRWGAAEEMVNVDRVAKLSCLEPLMQRKNGLKESRKILPVPMAYVDAIRPYVARPIWALIQLQANTGARGDELFRLRAVDIDTAGDVWIYHPIDHKTAHKEKTRVICFGPKSREVLSPFLIGRPIDAPLFSPIEANAERKRASATKSHPRRLGQRPNRTKTMRKIRESYDDASYRRAIQRACKAAGVPRWHPHQLRHNFSTEVCRRHGIEVSRAATKRLDKSAKGLATTRLSPRSRATRVRNGMLTGPRDSPLFCIVFVRSPFVLARSLREPPTERALRITRQNRRRIAGAVTTRRKPRPVN